MHPRPIEYNTWKQDNDGCYNFKWEFGTPSPSTLALVIAAFWVCLATLGVLLASGCSGAPLDPSRAPGGPLPVNCYTEALDAADRAAFERCGGVWSMCEHREEILSELDSALERCDSVAGE